MSDNTPTTIEEISAKTNMLDLLQVNQEARVTFLEKHQSASEGIDKVLEEIAKAGVRQESSSKLMRQVGRTLHTLYNEVREQRDQLQDMSTDQRRQGLLLERIFIDLVGVEAMPSDKPMEVTPAAEEVEGTEEQIAAAEAELAAEPKRLAGESEEEAAIRHQKKEVALQLIMRAWLRKQCDKDGKPLRVGRVHVGNGQMVPLYATLPKGLFDVHTYLFRFNTSRKVNFYVSPYVSDDVPKFTNFFVRSITTHLNTSYTGNRMIRVFSGRRVGLETQAEIVAALRGRRFVPVELTRKKGNCTLRAVPLEALDDAMYAALKNAHKRQWNGADKAKLRSATRAYEKRTKRLVV